MDEILKLLKEQQKKIDEIYDYIKYQQSVSGQFSEFGKNLAANILGNAIDGNAIIKK